MSIAHSSLTNSGVDGIRAALTLSGAVALFVGVIVIIGFNQSPPWITWTIAIYAVVEGLVYLGLSAALGTLGAGPRVVHAVLGLVFVAVGIIGMVAVSTAPDWAFLNYGIVIGIAWILEAAATLTMPGNEQAHSWSSLFAVLSVIAGIFVLFSPIWGGMVLWALFAWALAVTGSLQIVRAARFSVQPD